MATIQAHTRITSRSADAPTRASLRTSPAAPRPSQLAASSVFTPSSNRKCLTTTPRARIARVRSVNVMASSGNLKVMIAGAPAAGKGTQCARIVEKYGLVHISVGDLLRAEVRLTENASATPLQAMHQVAEGTPDGKKAKEYMDRGDLVPNEVVVDMVKNRLAQSDVAQHGWLLDGYPRSLEQAEAIEAVGIRPDIFLLIDVPDELLVDRVVGRRLDPETGEIYHLQFKPPPADIVDRLTQRSDDTEDKVLSKGCCMDSRGCVQHFQPLDFTGSQPPQDLSQQRGQRGGHVRHGAGASRRHWLHGRGVCTH